MEENTPQSPTTPPPPPLTPPPVIAPTGPAPRPRRGRGWMVFAIILLVLLGISVLFNIGGFLGGLFHGGGTYSSQTYGPKLQEVVREDHDSADKVAVIEVKGIITSSVIDQGGYSMVEILKAQLKRAQQDEHVKAVVLRVDSPGGEVLASDEINRAIRDFETKPNHAKPVIVSMGNLAASGGYYISAPCRWIVADDLTITGSIGVILSTWNYRGLMDKVGLLPQTFKSGKYKDMLSGSREPSSITPEEQAMVQHLIDTTYQRFKQVVQDGRDWAHKQNKSEGHALSPAWADYADGRILSGKEALDLGFVDQLGSFDTAVARARTIAGISSANLVEYQQRYDLADFLHMFSRSEAKPLKVDLGFDPPKLKAGLPYFLAPLFLQ